MSALLPGCQAAGFAGGHQEQGGDSSGNRVRSRWYWRPVVLFMGWERRGLSREHQALCDLLVRIPMTGRSDSLNLAVATGIMLYEVAGREAEVPGSLAERGRIHYTQAGEFGGGSKIMPIEAEAKRARLADRERLVQILQEQDERAGIETDPTLTVEQVRAMMLADGIRPERNEFSRELLRMRYEEE